MEKNNTEAIMKEYNKENNKEEHVHEHEGCCHHNHDEGHHHEHKSEEDGALPKITITTHDEALIGTVLCRIYGGYDEAKEELKTCMKQVADWVDSEGGLIGHIKAFVREEKRNCMISIADIGDMQIKEGQKEAVYVENANIVFGVDKEEFETKLKEIFGQYK